MTFTIRKPLVMAVVICLENEHVTTGCSKITLRESQWHIYIIEFPLQTRAHYSTAVVKNIK